MPINPDPNPTSVSLEVLFSIAPAKRLEFLQTVSSLISTPHEPSKPRHQSCFEKVGTKNTFLWRESWDTMVDLEGHLHSNVFRALLGAIGVLGELEKLEILTAQPPSTGQGDTP